MAVVACFLFSCKSSTDTAKVTDSTTANVERNKQTALKSDSAFIKKDIDGAFKDYAAGFVEYGSGESKPAKNIDSIKMSGKNFLAAFPDFKGENLKVVAEDSTVIITGDWSGTFKNEFMKIKPTGKSYKAFDADIFTFNKAGKITSHKSIQSEITFLHQLGVPIPPKK